MSTKRSRASLHEDDDISVNTAEVDHHFTSKNKRAKTRGGSTTTIQKRSSSAVGNSNNKNQKGNLNRKNIATAASTTQSRRRGNKPTSVKGYTSRTTPHLAKFPREIHHSNQRSSHRSNKRQPYDVEEEDDTSSIEDEEDEVDDEESINDDDDMNMNDDDDIEAEDESVRDDADDGYDDVDELEGDSGPNVVESQSNKSNRVNLKWTVDSTEDLIDAYIRVSEDNGQEQGGGLRPKFWKLIVEKLRDVYPKDLAGLDVVKCKNKWQTLKKDYVAYVSVFKRSGSGTHQDKKGIDESLLQDFPEARKFKDKPFQFYDSMSRALNETNFTGEDSTPVSALLDEFTATQDANGDGDDDQEFDEDDQQQTFIPEEVTPGGLDQLHLNDPSNRVEEIAPPLSSPTPRLPSSVSLTNRVVSNNSNNHSRTPVSRSAALQKSSTNLSSSIRRVNEKAVGSSNKDQQKRGEDIWRGNKQPAPAIQAAKLQYEGLVKMSEQQGRLAGALLVFGKQCAKALSNDPSIMEEDELQQVLESPEYHDLLSDESSAHLLDLYFASQARRKGFLKKFGTPSVKAAWLRKELEEHFAGRAPSPPSHPAETSDSEPEAELSSSVI